MAKLGDSDERELRRLQGLADLAAVVAHKLNNDLTEVTCNVGILLEDIEEGSPPDDMPQLLRDALHAAEHASRLSQEALGLFRLDARGAAPVSIERYLHDLVPRLPPTAHDVVCVSCASPHLVTTTPDRLDRILLPMLRNALEAAPAGPIDVVCEPSVPTDPDAVPQSIDPLSTGPYTAITVRDRGPGFSQSPETAAFTPFATTKEQGRGLGLSTALNVARAHAGSMSCRSHPGGGAEVTVWLPIASDGPPAPERG